MVGQGVRGSLRQAADAFTSNARNPNLRRAQLSFLGAWTAEWAFTVGLGIVAYRDGGATAVGLVGLLRMVPSAILAPLLSPLADRGRRERVLILVSVLRGVATGASRGRRRAGRTDRRSSMRWRCCRPSLPRSTDRRTPHCSRRSATPDTSCQRQCGPWAAGLRRHVGGSAAGSVAAAVHRRDRRVRCGGGRLVVGGRLAVAAALRRTSAAIRPDEDQPGERRPSKAFESSAGTATWH